jgi:protein tyrosine/serine phosphatase
MPAFRSPRLAWTCALALGFFLGMVALFYSLARAGDAFHVVVPGELCRAGQMSAPELSAAIDRHGIRTVVNLRGSADGVGWYREEAAALGAAGVRLVDFPMSAGEALSLEQMDLLVGHLRRGPAPVLVHCRAGADRAGLASALFLAATGRPPAEARAQLSWRYGHFPYAWWRERAAMDASLEAFLVRTPPTR